MNKQTRVLIQGGRVLDPASGFDEKADVAIVNGGVLAIKNIASDFQPERTIDATGCLVLPGLVDLAVRLREPGNEHGRGRDQPGLPA
jgi:dihydroorotase